MAKWKLKEKPVESEQKKSKFIPQKKEKTEEELQKIEEKKLKKAEDKAKAKEKRAANKEKRNKKFAAKKKKFNKKYKKFKKYKFVGFFKKVGKTIAIPFVFLGGLIAKILPKPKKKAPKLNSAKEKRGFKEVFADKRVKTMRNRIIGIVAMCVGVCVVILGGFKIAGGLELNAGYAAQTGDKLFTEQEVTKYITEQTYYKQYAKNLSGWKQYLSMYGLTPESFRKQTIEDKFSHDELVRLACEHEGIEVNEADVDSHMASFKAKYSNDSNYNKALESAGYTEETYRDNVRQTMLEKALIAKVITVDAPSDDDVKTYLSSYSSAYKDARKSSHILFDAKDKDKAQQVLDQINAGSLTWEAAVAQYSIDESTKAKGGDRGWDKIEKFSTDYNSGLSGLTAGQVNSSLVYDSEGIHIIKCTEKWDTPEKIESLDGVPQAIIEECRTKKKESNQATELKTWLETFASDNGYETKIFPMPSGLPYYVEVDAKSSSGLSTSTSTS